MMLWMGAEERGILEQSKGYVLMEAAKGMRKDMLLGFQRDARLAFVAKVCGILQVRAGMQTEKDHISTSLAPTVTAVQEAKLVLLKVYPVDKDTPATADLPTAWAQAERGFTLVGLQSAMAELKGLATYVNVRLDPAEAAERHEMHQELISLLERLNQSGLCSP